MAGFFSFSSPPNTFFTLFFPPEVLAFFLFLIMLFLPGLSRNTIYNFSPSSSICSLLISFQFGPLVVIIVSLQFIWSGFFHQFLCWVILRAINGPQIGSSECMGQEQMHKERGRTLNECGCPVMVDCRVMRRVVLASAAHAIKLEKSRGLAFVSLLVEVFFSSSFSPAHFKVGIRPRVQNQCGLEYL